MSRGTRIAATTAAAFACGCTSAAAQSPAIVTYDDTFTTRTPGAPAGRVFIDTFTNADDPSAKPPSVSNFRLKLPPGARFDTDAIAQCTATDAELTAQGASACPEDTHIGGELFLADTGFPEPNRFITADVVYINADDTIIGVGTDRATGARVVNRGTVAPDGEEISVPMLPGTPPEGAAVVREEARFDALVGPDGDPYLRTPPTCPKRGYWVLTGTYSFRNGDEQTLESRSPCDRATATPPRALRVAFYRRQAARAGRPGSIRVHASRAGSAKLTVLRAGERVARRAVTLRAGNQRVQLPALPRGRYVVRLAGREARLSVR
jgi:hypothetical protein